MKCSKCGGTDFYANGRCKACAREASRRSREKKDAALGKKNDEPPPPRFAVLDLGYRNDLPLVSGKMYFFRDEGLTKTLLHALRENPEASIVRLATDRPRTLRIRGRIINVQNGPVAPFCILVGVPQ